MVRYKDNNRERNMKNVEKFLQQSANMEPFIEFAKQTKHKMREEETQRFYYQYRFSWNDQEKAAPRNNEDARRQYAVNMVIGNCKSMYERVKVYGVCDYFQSKNYGNKVGCSLTEETIDINAKYKWD